MTREKALDALAALAAVAAGLFVLSLMFPGAAKAQDAYLDWIHKNRPDCCDHRDCKPATAAYTEYGWDVEGAALAIPHDKVIKWPFGVPYACWGWDIVSRSAYVRCLLMRTGT